MPFSWLDSRALVSNNLSNFVLNGGSVYASDWAHLIIEAAWPEKIDFVGDDDQFIDPTLATFDMGDTAYVGMATTVQGEVLDATMGLALGTGVADIVYDLDAWVVPLSADAGASVMIQGEVQTYDITTGVPSTGTTNVPLAIRFSEGGTVIYTTFHNELQMTMDMEIALKEIILSL